MRLSQLRGADAPLPAEVEAELEALDAALRGEDVPAGMEGLDALVSDLRAERATPEADFGQALDRWAAAGFPRGRRPGLREQATKGDARSWLASLTPRRLAYAGGAAATLIVLVVGVSRIDFQTDTDDKGGSDVSISAAEDAGPAAPVPEAEAPAVTDNGQSGRLEDAARYPTLREGRPGSAGGQEARKVDRDAQLTLVAPADEVQDVTNEAIGVVESHRGIVESSQTSGTDQQARATLQLAIPTRNLDSALDELSDLADVKSLSEGTVDITRPFVDAKDRLAGLNAERRSVLAQIRLADTEAELDALKLRLDSIQRAIAQAEAEFDNIQRRAVLSSVTLQITSEGADEGDWSLEDALGDAGRVLTVGAGIALISAAVLLPLALIAAIAYFVMSAARNRARNRALDE
jgi:hypothetical protein